MGVLFGALALSSGCASIVSDSKYPVSINSNPSGANFLIKDKNGMVVHSGKTPEVVLLKAGAGYFSSATYSVYFKKKGYGDVTRVLDTELDGWYIGNILFGGIIGFLIVDPITGAMWKLPEFCGAGLEKTSPDTTIVSEVE